MPDIGRSGIRYAMFGTVWTFTFPPFRFCIYVSSVSIGKFWCPLSGSHQSPVIWCSRYIAICKPLKYSFLMTKKVVAMMLLFTWIGPTFLSFLPIFMGWYTTNDNQAFRQEHPDECIFKVNQYYAVVSSSISFWIPGSVMIFMYSQIFREANRYVFCNRRTDIIYWLSIFLQTRKRNVQQTWSGHVVAC